MGPLRGLRLLGPLRGLGLSGPLWGLGVSWVLRAPKDTKDSSSPMTLPINKKFIFQISIQRIKVILYVLNPAEQLPNVVLLIGRYHSFSQSLEVEKLYRMLSVEITRQSIPPPTLQVDQN